MLKETREVSSEQVLVWAQRVEVQRAQKAVLENLRDAKDFDLVKRDRQRWGQNRQQREAVKEKKVIENSKYCGMTHLQKQCRGYGKTYSPCGKVNHYKVACRRTQRQRQSQGPFQRNKAVHKVQQKEPQIREQRDSGRNFDSVNIRYLNF